MTSLKAKTILMGDCKDKPDNRIADHHSHHKNHKSSQFQTIAV